MAITSVPLLREDSILAWDIKGASGVTRGIPGVSASAQWQSLGRVDEWTDLGPEKAVYRDAIAGSGRQGATIGVAGTSYKPKTIGPFQVVDPRIMGFAWGQEVNAPVATGVGGGFRHTVSPTTRGALPYMDVQMADYKAGALTDGLTFLDVIMPRLSVRGEEVSEAGDETSGRVMIAPTLLPHDHSTAVAAKTVSLPTSTPYYKQHASLQFYNGDIDWRIHSWEYTLDNNAHHNYYHTNLYNGKPTEAAPEGAMHDLRLDLIADGHANSVSAKILRDLLLDEVKGNAQIKYIRTANVDEWAINLTDVQISEAPKTRRRGKIHYEVVAPVRASTFEYVDTNAARYFPA